MSYDSRSRYSSSSTSTGGRATGRAPSKVTLTSQLPAVQRKPQAAPPTYDMDGMDLATMPGGTADEYNDFADAGESKESAALESKPPTILRISAQGQVDQAQQVIEEIQRQRPELMIGIRDRQIDSDVPATNEATIGALGDLTVKAVGHGMRRATWSSLC